MEAEGWKRREVRGIETTAGRWQGEEEGDGGYRLILGRFLAAPDSPVVRARLPSRMPDNNGKVSLGREKERERNRHPGHKLSLRKQRRDWN